ncbi:MULTISPECIES: bifunctional adenosylcobinamide kinase/adenosylcobinamide-phosphate guanylyltransferase [unclassified Clostridium]|uniref:bifunctional adenosylcobinamide kinase/adenosylcobinamide-phosphate guanylyltransferase n=1 Tax=unclassified Clostridium TaxID=2614128 RepID=UPI00029786E3|nr:MULTISPECIES: bifunctional adenosylcobinamide kinase/adenosylcobinamide-phosphate guanylyltransferase [unclassified Clostridium]EKQ53403.1 MAG: adenosyl cobinamide kinase/adenosyl cobinamide phosphate guanylyltransferase [Clostridium sp. Maddingley MBC34-26]
MELIFGGAYNGKLKFVKENFNVNDDEIFFCKDQNLDLYKKVICGLHIFIRACVLNDINSLEFLERNINLLKDKIIICDEINSGIVPMEKINRAWREETGRALQFLSGNSSNVYRIFFGIEEKLK